MSDTSFTLAEARVLMPDVHLRAERIVRLRADLAELSLDLHTRGESTIGNKAEAKAYEARLDEAVSWFGEHGIEVKGLAPLLVDFPAKREGRSIRLCWLEGEPELAWYHLTELGFMGRRPLD
jgi:hypothetical protein